MFRNFELVYIRIQNKKCFDENEFYFSEEYEIKYKDKNINIKKKLNNKFKDFFHKNIHSINVIVGKNGAGKTTLLDFIGSKNRDEHKPLNLDKNDTGWFILYKCNEGNTFFIEGSNSGLLPCLQKLNGYYEENGLYSVFFNYDFSKNKIIQCDFLNMNEEMPSIFYFRGDNANLFSNINEKRNIDVSSISREYVKNGNLQDLYRLATLEKKFFKEVSDNASFLKIKFLKTKNDLFDENFTKDYIDSKDISKNEKCCFLILQQIIFNIYEILLETNYRISEEFDMVFEYMNYLDNDKKMEKLEMLLTKLCEECDKKSKKKEKHCNKHYSRYGKYIMTICDRMKELPFEKRNTQDKLSICQDLFSFYFDLKNGCNKSVDKFLGLFELENEETGFSNSFRRMFDISFDNTISEGESQFINTYSSIYSIMSHLNNSQKSIIILLDEPDKNFHPMWISSFIKNLVSLVDFASKDIKYQFIITTHSPFMLSDMPKEYVTCIDIDDKTKKRIVRKATKSFASNYYQIIQDSFFLEDSVGQFAKEKINHVIKRINNINQNDIKECDIQNIQNTISIIDDPHLKTLLTNLLNKKISKYNKKESLRIEKEMLESRLKDIKNELGE